MTTQGGAQGGPPRGGRKGGKGAIVAAVVGLLVLVGAGIGAYVFWMGSRTKSVAREHLPGSCEVVIRVDVESLLEAKAVQKHIVEPIEEKATELENAGEVSRFVAAKIDPRKHLKELVVCVTDVSQGKPSFVGIMGGSLAQDAVVQALDSHDEDNAFGAPKEHDGRLVIQHKDSGIYITQSTEDAAILFSSDKSRLDDVDGTSGDWKDYELPLGKPISAQVTKKAAESLTKQLNAIPGLSLSGAGEIEVTGSLEPGRLDADIGLGDPEGAKSFVSAVNSFLSIARLSPIGPTSSKEAKQLLGGTKLEADGGTVKVKVKIPDDLVDEACEQIGQWAVELEEG